MYIYNELLTDENCKEKINTIIRKIRINAGLLDTYIICLSQNNDMFDIIDCKNLKQKGYPKKDLHIMGIAKGKGSAIELSTKLLLDLSGRYGMNNFKKELLIKQDTLFRRY